jgi:anti-anti-sigma factor
MDIQALPLVADVVGSDATRVVFELNGVTFMDARGLGMMVEIQRRALEAGGCVRLAAPSKSVRRVLTLTGCDPIFETFESLRRAVSPPSDTTARSAS